MKKIMALGCAVFFASASALFANVEMDLNCYVTPSHSYTMDVVGNPEFKQKTAFGFEEQFGFFFGAPAKFLDIGLNLSAGMDYFKTVTLKSGGYSYDYDAALLGMNMNMILGPLVRFHVGDMNSFYVSPGLKLNFGLLGYEYKTYSGYSSSSSTEYFFIFTPAFNLDLGYRVWVANKTGFHFGFDTGLDLSWDTGGSVWGSDIDSVDITDGFGANLYFGVCFNFGDKAYK